MSELKPVINVPRDREDTARKRCHAYVCEWGERDRISQNDRIDEPRRRARAYTHFITIMPATNAGHAYYVLKIAAEYYAVFGRTRSKANALVGRRSRLPVSSRLSPL